MGLWKASDPYSDMMILGSLYNEAKWTIWAIPHVSRWPYALTVGFENLSVACISFSLATMEKGDIPTLMIDIYQMLDQLKTKQLTSKGPHPMYLGTSCDNHVFNIFFKAERSIIEYFNAKNADATLVGYHLLSDVLEKMEAWWRSTRLITRNPMLTFCFTNPGIPREAPTSFL